MLTSHVAQVGKEHYDVATAVQKTLQDYKGLQDIIAILGMDELSEEDKLTVERARKIQVFITLLVCGSMLTSGYLRSSGSCPSLSRLHRSSPATRASSSPLRTLCDHSRKSSRAATTHCPKLPSTW